MSGKALFLDRDGIINVDKTYVFRTEDFEFVDGIFEVCRIAQERGFLLVIVTNQAGIGRGHYTEEDFRQLTNWMLARFADRNIVIDKVYYCPFHPEFGVGAYRCDSFDRKPNPGMILRARAELDLDLAASILVGDKATDVQAGVAAGVGTNVLMSPDLMQHGGAKADFVFRSMRDLERWVAAR
jgi:D-glycero-D-manno-heptose 1,7-bisphosphate phosphatase